MSGIEEGLVEKVGSFVKDAVTRKSQEGFEDEQSRIEKGEPLDRKGKGKEKVTEGPEAAEEQIWLHCSVGDVIDDEEVTNELPSASTDFLAFSFFRNASRTDSKGCPLPGRAADDTSTRF